MLATGGGTLGSPGGDIFDKGALIGIGIQNGQLVGVITDRDIVVRVVADGLDPHLEQAALHMTRDPISVSPDTSVDAAAKIMADQQIRRLPVVEDGKLVGYLALGDLALQNRDARIGDTLEQISEPAGQQGRVPERQNNV